MALSPLDDDQLNELSDEELDARMHEERLQGVEEINDDPEPEPEVVDDEVVDLEVEDDEVILDEEDEPSNDEVDVADDEPSDVEAGDLDGEPAAATDETNPETTETPSYRNLIVDGNEVPINDLEELYTLASAGGQFTRKMQEISQHKKSLSIMQANNLTEADLSLLIEARNGDKNALASLVKQSGIDTMDVPDEVDASYTPGAHIPSDQQINLQDVQREISNDPEYQITQNVVNNMMDTRSQDMMVQNPDMIRGIHADIKSGVYQAVSAEAQKLKMLDGGRRSDMEYYISAAQQGDEPRAQAPQNVQQQQPAPVAPAAQKPNNASRKRAAASSRSKAPTTNAIDFDDMGDDELMAYREKIMANY